MSVKSTDKPRTPRVAAPAPPHSDPQRPNHTMNNWCKNMQAKWFSGTDVDKAWFLDWVRTQT